MLLPYICTHTHTHRHTSTDTPHILDEHHVTFDCVCFHCQGLTGFPGAAGRIGAAGPAVSIDFIF